MENQPNQEQAKIIVEHRELNKLSDSIEVGTPAKGGAIKIYGDSSNKADFQQRIDNMLELRKYAQAKLGGAE